MRRSRCLTEAMAESTDNVNRQAKKGIRVLLVREGFLLVLTFAGGIVLARVLDPADFGLFGITTFLVKLLAQFSDCGLAPSLIQRNETPSDRDLQVGFTLQQILVTLVVVALWFAAPWLAGFYPKAPDGLIWLVRVLAFNLYLGTWRSISVLQLERRLHYKPLAVVSVVETVSYQVVAVGMAVLGFGVWSLIAAVLLQGVLGTVLIYSAAPWRIRFAFDRTIAATMLRFGLPYQLQSTLGNMKGWVAPTLVASLIGPDALGFLTWGSSNGRKPMRLFQNVIRVSFPHFARLQGDQDEVERLLSKYQVYFLTVAGWWFSVLAIAGYDLTHWIYTEKWLPAVPVLILSGVLLGLNAVSWSTKSALNGLGRVHLTMRVTLVATVLSNVLGAILIFVIGFIGVPVGLVIALLVTLPWLYRGLRPGALHRVLRPTAWIILPVVASMAVGFGAQMLPVSLAVRALSTAGVVTLAYLGIAWLAAPAWLKQSALTKLSRLTEKVNRLKQPAL